MKKLTLALTLCIPFISSCDRINKMREEKQASKEAFEDMERSNRAAQEEMLRKFEETGEITHDSEAMDKTIQNLRKAGESMSDEHAALARVSARFLEDSNAEAKLIQQMSEQVITVPDYSQVSKIEDLQAKKKIVSEYKALNEGLLKKYQNGLVDEVKALLDKEKISSKNQADFLAGVRTSTSKRIPHIVTVRKTDLEICDALTKQLDILEKNFGKWSQQDGIIVFENEEVIEPFNSTFKTLESAGARQATAQEKLIELIKKGH